MALKASNTPAGGTIKPLEAGIYPCWVVQVVDLGIQPQQPWKGEEKAPTQEILLTYEFADEFLKDEEGNEIDDKPRFLSENFRVYSLASDKAKSTQRYLSLDPTREYDGDFAQLGGVPCNVAVLTNEKGDKVYNNIGVVTPMREKDKRRMGNPVNAPIVFDLDEPDADVFFSLQKWIQDRITKNVNYTGSELESLVNAKQGAKAGPAKNEEAEPEGDDLDDDLPF